MRELQVSNELPLSLRQSERSILLGVGTFNQSVVDPLPLVVRIWVQSEVGNRNTLV